MDQNLRPSKFTRLRQGLYHLFNPSRPGQKPYFYIPNTQSVRGSALVMATIFMLVATTLITVGVKLAINARKDTQLQAIAMAEAENAARAGLLDALGWFQRQPAQPVAATTLFGAAPNPTPTYGTVTIAGTPVMPVSFIDQVFNPTYNTANPFSTDTLDGSLTIGIVNEFSPDGAGSINEATTIGNEPTWERYEVQKQLASAATLMPNAAHDITGERINAQNNGTGLVWNVTSTGYVYKRLDFSKSATTLGPVTWATPYNAGKNKILAKAIMSSEFRKVYLNKPWGQEAALYTKSASWVNLTNANGILSNGGKTGTFAVADSDAVSTIPTGASVTNLQVGMPVTYNNPNASFYLDPNQVFGMPVNDIQRISDVVGNAGTTIDFAGNSPANELIYYGGNLTIDPTSAVTQYRSMNASGILVVNGNLTVNSNATTVSYFDGIIYVTGNLTLTDSQINGAVIMGYAGPSTATAGRVTITGTGADHAKISYNPRIWSNLQTSVATYKEDISARRVLSAVPNL